MPKKKMKKDERVNVNLDYGEEVTVAESPGGRVGTCPRVSRAL